MAYHPTFNPLSFEQANPLIAGLMQGQKFGQSMQQFPLEQEQRRLANALSEFKRQQEAANAPYYARNALASTLKAEAEPAEIQARTGYYGAQTGKLGKETQWYDKEAAAKISGQEAEAEYRRQEARKTKFLQDYLTGQGEGGGKPAYGTATTQPEAQNMPNASGGSNATAYEPTQQFQPSSGPYGIDVQQPTKQDLINKVYFGLDTFAPKQDQVKSQIIQQKKDYDEKLEQATQISNGVNKMEMALDKYNMAMDNAYFKGANLGWVPSEGMATIPFRPLSDMSNEQQADYQANQMLPGAIADMRDAMGTVRFSNLDLIQSQKMKFFRGMNDDVRNSNTKWVKGVQARTKEMPNFYGYMSNPVRGASKQIADVLWTQYQQDFPMINEKGKVMTENLKKWPMYTTPQAINSIKNGGTFKPTKEMINSIWMQAPDGNLYPVHKNKVAIAVQKLNWRTL